MLFEQEDRCYVSNYNIATVGKSAPASCVLCKYLQCSLIANTSHKLFFFPPLFIQLKTKAVLQKLLSFCTCSFADFTHAFLMNGFRSIALSLYP